MVQQLGGGEEERDQGYKRLLVFLERPKGRLRDALGQPGLCLLVSSVVSCRPSAWRLVHLMPCGMFSLSEVQCIVGLLLGMPIPWPSSDPL